MRIFGSKIFLIVVVLIALCAGLSGCIEDEGDADLEFEGKVCCDEDLITITVRGGDINWSGKEVRVDNFRLVTSQVSSADGDEVEFIDTTGTFDAEEGTSYRVRIVYMLTSEILWEEDITAEDGGDSGDVVRTLSVTTSIDATEDTVIFNVVQGDVNWSTTSIRMDGGKDLTTTSTVTSAGGTVTFYDPEGNWDAEPGVEYNIKIVDDSRNMVIYDNDVIAG